MLYFIIYLVVGVLVLFGIGYVHACKAMVKGYDDEIILESWNEYGYDIGSELDFKGKLLFMLKLIVDICLWPISVFNMTHMLKEMYELYEENKEFRKSLEDEIES